MSKPTKEQIDDAIDDMADRYLGRGARHSERTNFGTIESAYRFEHARAEMLERQNRELISWNSDQTTPEGWFEMLDRHAREWEALE